MDKDCNPACRGGKNAASERSARGLIGEQAILFAHRWRGATRRRGRVGDDIQIRPRDKLACKKFPSASGGLSGVNGVRTTMSVIG